MTKVLLAEHDPELLCVYASELERNKFGIVTSIDANEAVGKFVEHAPEIAILDYDLPNGGGLDVLRKILTIRPQTKIVMLTSKGQDIEEAEQIGLELFLLKPVSPQLLVRSTVALSDTKSRPPLMVVTR